MKEDIEAFLRELLDSQPEVPHGQVFDDGRRWCHGCMRPRNWDASLADEGWRHRSCPVCTAVWPEFVEEFVASALQDEIEDISLAMIH